VSDLKVDIVRVREARRRDITWRITEVTDTVIAAVSGERLHLWATRIPFG
jgi:hypothetical protein